MAQAYGFNHPPRVKDEVRSSIPSANGGAAALGASAIGQGRVLATPLEMATVAATVANGGVRERPRLLSSVPVQGRQVVSAAIADELRQMMRAVVLSGTGTAAAISGVPVAGKTGTAELRDVGASDTGTHPTNTDAWFVAFPAIAHPPLAVAVMLVGAGAGGASAAPLARSVLLAGLGR
jgi:peptidoglycan glycosyltransferase